MLPESAPGSDADLVDLAFFLGQKTKQTFVGVGKLRLTIFFVLKKPSLGTIYETQFKGSDWTVLENVC